jgi:hypothetical protein
VGLFSSHKRAPRPNAHLTAAGQRINLKARNKTIRRADQSNWQTKAWEYRDAIGEIRFATQFLSNAVSKVRFYVAEVKPGQDVPTPLPAKEPKDSALTPEQARTAQQELERLPLRSGYSFLGVLSENLGIAGEAFLHGYYNDTDGSETWEILSTTQVQLAGTGDIQIKDSLSGQFRSLRKDNKGELQEELIRLWRPHPKDGALADAPLISLGVVCDTLILVEAESQASTQSRIASNGLLAIPEGFELPKQNKTDDDNNPSFMEELTEALVNPINDPGAATAAVPVVIQGQAEDIQAIKFFRFDREDQSSTSEKAERALRTLARSLDVPPEIITGLGDSNHWSAWQIDTSTYEHHIDPMVRLVADSLTMGYLRPALKELGWENEDLQKIQIWHDPGQLTENPNRTQDTLNAFDRGGIGYETFRDMLGFTEDDAPTPEELQTILAFKSGLNPDMAASILHLIRNNTEQPTITIDSTTTQAPRQIAPSEAQDAPTTAEDATPNTQPAAPLTAAAATTEPQWAVDYDLGRELSDIDRELRERILTLIDATIDGSINKAGNQLRTHANKTPKTRAIYKNQLAELSGVELLAHTGRDTALELGLNEDGLITELLNSLKPRIVKWTQAAIKKTLATIFKAAKISPDSQRAKNITTRFSQPENLERAWNTLTELLSKHMQNRMYNPNPNKPTFPAEEVEHSTPTQPVSDFINTVGGNTPHSDTKGLATGTIANNVLAETGHHNIGFQWRYGPTPPENTFPPHFKLAGKKFTGFDDPGLIPPVDDAWVGPVFHPGDHEGCLCDYMPIYAIDEANQTLRDRLSVEKEGMSGARMLADLDNAAGRSGTNAQRTTMTRDTIQQLQRRYIND